MRLASVAGDLNGKSVEQIRDACKRYRQNGENRFFPTSGQLLDLMKNPYEDPPNKHREIFGPNCKCSRCVNKTPSDGFFRAPTEDYRKAEKERQEMAYWTESKTATSKLDEAEMHKRFLMTQELVRDHGMEWEAARRKVMVQRTRELYPEFTIWPALGAETDAQVDAQQLAARMGE